MRLRRIGTLMQELVLIQPGATAVSEDRRAAEAASRREFESHLHYRSCVNSRLSKISPSKTAKPQKAWSPPTH